MRLKFHGALLVLAGLVSLAVPALAHHSATAEFNVNSKFTLKGTITKVDWINPHIYLHMDVKDDSGKVSSWLVETSPPGLMHRAGLTKESLGLGQTVTLYGYGAKDGTKNLMWMRKITFADGHTVDIRSPIARQDGVTGEDDN